jgi:hypothetical protein
MRSTVALAMTVLVLWLAGPGSSSSMHELYAWARVDKPIAGISKVGLHFGDPVARHVAPGTYRVHVAARGDMAFHLAGPGIDRQTRFTTDYGPVYATWRIRLRRGRYVYSAEGLYAKELQAAGIRTRGSFTVP